MSTPLGPPDGYGAGLRALLAQMAPPYGFTLATFTSAGLAAHFTDQGPGPWELLLFLAGAFVGYAALAVGATGLRGRLHPRPIPLMSWQAVHVVPLAAVFLLGLLSAVVVPPPLVWFTNGAALTIGYLSSLAAVIWLLRGRHGDGSRPA